MRNRKEASVQSKLEVTFSTLWSFGPEMVGI